MQLTPEILDALREYIDCRINELIATNEQDELGYTQSAWGEKKRREEAWEDVIKANNKTE